MLEHVGGVRRAAERGDGAGAARARRRRPTAACRAAARGPWTATSTPARCGIRLAVRGEHGRQRRAPARRGRRGRGRRARARRRAGPDRARAARRRAGSARSSRAARQRLGLLARAAAEVDLEPGAGERDGEAGAPRAGADDRGAADRRQAAEPLPLQHHARPDAVGHGRGQRRARASSTCGKRSGRPARMRTLCGRMRQPRADRLGADHRDRDDRRAGLQREPADAALGLAERAGPDARALGEDQDAVAAREDRLGGVDHVAGRPSPRSTGKAPSALSSQPEQPVGNSSFLAT